MTNQKSKTKKELCQEFNCSYATLKKWLEPLKNELGNYIVAYTPRQVNIIYKHIVFV